MSPLDVMFLAIRPYLIEASLHVDHSRYHFTDEAPLPIQTAEGEVKLGKGWLAISEIEYQGLRWLQEEYMRKFAPESISNPTFSAQETWEIETGAAMTEAQKTAFFQAAHYISGRLHCRTQYVGYNKTMRDLEDAFGLKSPDVYRLLQTNHERAWQASQPKPLAAQPVLDGIRTSD